MTLPEQIQLLGNLVAIAKTSVTLAKTAARGNQSLAGDNPYGQKFHALTVDLKTLEGKVRLVLVPLDLDKVDVNKFYQSLGTLQNAKSKVKERAQAAKDLEFIVLSVIQPKLETNTVGLMPTTEDILPMEVVRGTGKYYERLIVQANGCYERGWFDACLVMVRKFFESLIIAVYEQHGKAEEIKKAGEFVILQALVDKINSETKTWNLGRESKPALREIRGDGNRSAHTRRFNAEKADVDKLRRGIRVAADDLLHLAKLK